MQIGILSDSHGDAAITARAVALLESNGAERLFHCGDICSELVLDELAGHHCAFVWGNCDAPSPVLRRYVENLGLRWPDGPLKFELDGKRLAVFHGHEPGFRQAVAEGGFDYIFHGHTHHYADERANGCRVINPGALYRARVKTVAIVSLDTDEVRFLRVDSGEELQP